MRTGISVALVLTACGGGGATEEVDAGAPALEVPALIALPYVDAGGGATMIEVTVANRGTTELHPSWAISGSGGIAIGEAPALLAPGAEAPLVVRWDGSETELIAGATIQVDSEAGARSIEVWGVAGDPAIGDATFEPVSGPGGVVIGQSAVVSMPTAPYPDGDARVHLFVPDGYRQRPGGHDLVLHFHGHNTTIDATVPAHRYREQVYASGANVVLIVPQGPVNAASGDFGQLMDTTGTSRFLDQVTVVLYREGVITRPAFGELTLTSHSGGYQAAALNRDLARQIDLFDSLYGYQAQFQDFVEGEVGVLRSNYTATGGTDANNQALAAALGSATAATQENLRDAPSVIYATGATHDRATRDDGAYGEQLRWGGHASRRGPRVELRRATAGAGTATVAWLAPHDDDVTGFRVETSPDGAAWAIAAETGAEAASATFALAAATRVRVVPVVDGVDDPQPSDVVQVAPDADVLVVDGFDRLADGSWGALAHDFAARVGEAAGGVHTVSNEAIGDDGFDPSPYRAVIWLVGDESSDDHTFTAAERAALDAYLDGGGRVILSGSEIGYDLAAGGAAWLAAATGAVFAADDAGAGTAEGAGPLAAVPSFTFGGAAALYAEDYPDAFTAATGAVVLLQYSTGAAAAVGIAGRGAVVGFPLEVIDAPADLAALVAALLDFVA